MTTMRSAEPLTGIDAVLAAVLPFLNGAEPQPGEPGTDRHGNIHRWTGTGWQLTQQADPEREAGQ